MPTPCSFVHYIYFKVPEMMCLHRVVVIQQKQVQIILHCGFTIIIIIMGILYLRLPGMPCSA